MSITMRRTTGHGLHHRHALERAGWRTLLEYCEHHVRDLDGTLVTVTPWWIAEAERANRYTTTVVTAAAVTQQDAWSQLRRKTADADRRTGRHRDESGR